uniref:Uncharacterized protein n=1 Tax=Caenorhabditis japonica TaxID=281687 RepID=A0A8R1IBZ5_CAEJA
MDYHCDIPLVLTLFKPDFVGITQFTNCADNFPLSASLDQLLPSLQLQESLSCAFNFSERTPRTDRNSLARRDHLRLLVTSRRHVMRGATREERSLPAAYTDTARTPTRLLVCVSPNGLLLAVTLYGTTGILPTVILGTHGFYSMYSVAAARPVGYRIRGRPTPRPLSLSERFFPRALLLDHASSRLGTFVLLYL